MVEKIAADPQPGDIYRTSWGYDQTNVEFFQVVRRTPGTVTLRRIAAEVRDGRLWPCPGQWTTDYHLGSVGPETESTYSEKVCRLATKLAKWQTVRVGLDMPEVPRMGASLTIDDVRTAWPYVGGGAYDTHAAGGMGH